MAKPDTRPVHLNLFRIRFPVTAILSIMHRIMGVFMVLALPFLIYVLGLSLSSEIGYKEAVLLLQSPWVLFFGTLFVWALAHHLLAGIRYLFLDFDIGVEKPHARLSAYIVNFSAGLITLVFIGYIL